VCLPCCMLRKRLHLSVGLVCCPVITSTDRQEWFWLLPAANTTVHVCACYYLWCCVMCVERHLLLTIGFVASDTVSWMRLQTRVPTATNPADNKGCSSGSKICTRLAGWLAGGRCGGAYVAPVFEQAAFLFSTTTVVRYCCCWWMVVLQGVYLSSRLETRR